MQNKVLLLGAGSIGSRHAKLLADRGCGISVFDTNRQRAQELAKEVGGEFIEQHPDMNGFNIVWICSPGNCHSRQIIDACKANCHVFVEKPLCVLSSETYDVIRAYKNKVMVVGYNIRHHAGTKKIYETLQSNILGRPLYARFECSTYLPNWHPQCDYREEYSAFAKRGGGVLLDLSHELDLAQFLFGFAKKNISCRFSTISDLEIQSEDFAEVWWEANNVYISIMINYFSKNQKRIIHIECADGNISWDINTGVVTIRSGDKRTLNFPVGSIYDSYKNEHDAFFDLINGHKSIFLCTLYEAVKTVELVERCKGQTNG